MFLVLQGTLFEIVREGKPSSFGAPHMVTNANVAGAALTPVAPAPVMHPLASGMGHV